MIALTAVPVTNVLNGGGLGGGGTPGKGEFFLNRLSGRFLGDDRFERRFCRV